jgi:hypothetical protein
MIGSRYGTNLDAVRIRLDAAEELCELDPAAAMYLSCETVRAVCVAVLSNAGQNPPAGQSLASLFEAAAQLLHLREVRPDLMLGTAKDFASFEKTATHYRAQPPRGIVTQADGTVEDDSPDARRRIASLAVWTARPVCEVLFDEWRLQARPAPSADKQQPRPI